MGKKTRNRKIMAYSVMFLTAAVTITDPVTVAAAKKSGPENVTVMDKVTKDAWVDYDVNDCVSLSRYSKTELNGSITTKVKQDIKEYINDILSEYPSYTKIEKTIVQKGDYVNVDITGYVDGETNPGIEVKNFTVHVGDKILPEKLENSLVGKVVGQQYEISCKSTEYNEEYNGYNAQFSVTVNKIVHAEVYDYDTITEKYAIDTFKVKDLDDFYKKMEAEAASNLYAYKKDALYKSFKDTTIVIPKGLTAQKYDQAKQMLIHQTFGDDTDLYKDCITEYTGLKQADYERSLYEGIKANLPKELLLMCVARKEGIYAKGEAYEAYLTNMIARGGFLSRENLFDYYESTYEPGEEYLKRQYILYAVVNHFCDYTVDDYEETVYTEPIKDEDIIGCRQYAVPPTTGFKSFMSYSSITSRNSSQYALQAKAETDYNGIRMIDGRYLVALGTHFGAKVGQYVDLVLEDGTTINCILGDVKADRDTDINNIVTTHNGCCSEFIVDAAAIPDKVKITGDVSRMYGNWSSPVKSVMIYDKYVEENVQES